jgi:hypothetical protein
MILRNNHLLAESQSESENFKATLVVFNSWMPHSMGQNESLMIESYSKWSTPALISCGK